MADFTFPSTLGHALKGAETVLLLVPDSQRKSGWLELAIDTPWRFLVEKGLEGKEAGPSGQVLAFVNPEAGPKRILVAILPDRVSRHNAPARTDTVMMATRAADLGQGTSVVIACIEEPAHTLAVASAVVRAVPLYSRKTNGRGKAKGARKKARLTFLPIDVRGTVVSIPAADRAQLEAARWAARLVDTPTSEMTTADFERAVRKAARGIPNLRVTAIKGDQLLEHGLEGIHAVGRTAEVAPRLLVLDYRPTTAKGKAKSKSKAKAKAKAKPVAALVGKGVVYDTGGLSLKPSRAMSGMKKDMGGAAAVAGATLALAKGKAKQAVVGVLALAENAIGPSAYRPDDILTMHSGKTVEINNTDAEGRLLLADAVSWVARKRAPAYVADAATLTGAQAIATGLRHAAIVSNREGLERRAVATGKATGDLVHPLPFAPEFFQDEFRSKVADMKNSVANRMNAQSSCAAQFVYSHIQDLDVPWLHVDLAGPSARDERATGFGVLLLAELVRAVEPADLEA